MDTKRLTIAALGCFAVLLLPEIASATAAGTTVGDNPIGRTLCTVRGWFSGAVGAGIATLAVIIIGVGALLGKVSWGMAMIVGLGVAIIFGAENIVTALNPSTTMGWNNAACDNL